MGTKKEVALIYARQSVGGGSTSFTAHLVEGFRRAGLPYRLLRIDERPKRPRRLAKYDNIILETATPDELRDIVRSQPSVLLAPEHSKKLPEDHLLKDLMALGMRVVIHDPNEFIARKNIGIYDHLDDRSLIKRPLAIRPSMKTHFKDALFIPHPYVPEFSEWQGADLAKRKTGCSIARLTFVKRPIIILDANRLLPKSDHIQFHGAENRMFTHFRLAKDYPEFKQGGYTMPLVWGISARKAREYALAVDMTYFPQDGGGSQYTFMEAWDAGSVNVIHKDWLRYEGEMADGVNCLAIEGPEELAALVKQLKSPAFIKRLKKISQDGYAHLIKEHDAVAVAKRYHQVLTR